MSMWGCPMPWNWSHRQLWAAMWVLGSEPRSSGRAASALYHGVISLDLMLYILKHLLSTHMHSQPCNILTKKSTYYMVSTLTNTHVLIFTGTKYARGLTPTQEKRSTFSMLLLHVSTLTLLIPHGTLCPGDVVPKWVASTFKAQHNWQSSNRCALHSKLHNTA